MQQSLGGSQGKPSFYCATIMYLQREIACKISQICVRTTTLLED
jgi:hypothetical protein